MKSDDVALIQRALAGDEAAFATLITKYQKQIHAYTLRKIGDFHIAEDIVQEVFLEVYQKLDTLKDPTKFSTWVYTIANHLCIAWYRKKQLQPELLQEIYVSATETDAYSRYVAFEQAKTTANAQRELVKKLLDKLKENEREIVTLHYFEEMTSSEIGSYLGISENTIKSQIRRARQRLKKYESMIQDELDIAWVTKQRSQQLLKGESSMSDEVRNQYDVDTRLAEMKGQIADLQEQMEAIVAKSKTSNDTNKTDRLDALIQLPHDAEDLIRWGYGGAYRTASGMSSKRGSVWTFKLSNFLSKAPDTEIVNLAKYFTNPTIVAVLRQLVEGDKSVSELAKGCDITEAEIEKTVKMLIDGNLALRKDDNQIQPKNDAVFYYLNFVGMTNVFLNPEKYHSGN